MATVSPEQSSSQPAHDQSRETPAAERGSIERIQELLRTKNDTSRFVGLALLKSVLDNSPELRHDEKAVNELWKCIPSKFLDRLLRTGVAASASSQSDSRDMLDLAVAVIHTFTLLLPEESRRDVKLVGRIPLLASAILQSSEATTPLIIQTLLSLVSFPEGAQEFTGIDDMSSLIEIAPSQPLVLDVLSYALLNSTAVAVAGTRGALAVKIEQVLQAVISSFSGTDAVTLLSFLAGLLRRLDGELLPRNPTWLRTLVNHIRNLASSRPTAAARAAYVNLAATLLQVYPLQSPALLFTNADSKAEKPFSYLFINLLLIDLRSSFPTLLEQLNSPDYDATSRRLASDFDVISCFIGYLVRSLDGVKPPDDDHSSSVAATPYLSMPPDLLLKIRKNMSEAMSVAIEFLRDRWDASVAGALGLHPDARTGEAKTSRGSHLTIAWDSLKHNVGDDPLVLSAVRCLAIWLREDDSEVLRKEAAGLCDMLIELYKANRAASSKLDFRRPVLVALEGITAIEEGVEAFLAQDGFKVLSDDLLRVAETGLTVRGSGSGSGSGTSGVDDDPFSRGIEIVRILLPIVENEHPGSREEWLHLATRIAAWDIPEEDQQQQQQKQSLSPNSSLVALRFLVAALQLVTSVLASSHPNIWRRYRYTISAIRGLATRLEKQVGDNGDLREDLQDVTDTLATL